MFCHRNSPVSGSGEGALASQRADELGPQRRHLRQHADAGADVLAAFGVVGGQRRHRLRPQPCPGGGAVVELGGADAEPVGFAADFVERHQPGVAVEQAVLHDLGGHRAAQLLQARPPPRRRAASAAAISCSGRPIPVARLAVSASAVGSTAASPQVVATGRRRCG